MAVSATKSGKIRTSSRFGSGEKSDKANDSTESIYSTNVGWMPTCLLSVMCLRADPAIPLFDTVDVKFLSETYLATIIQINLS